jgi:hypothetical protein
LIITHNNIFKVFVNIILFGRAGPQWRFRQAFSPKELALVQGTDYDAACGFTAPAKNAF